MDVLLHLLNVWQTIQRHSEKHVTGLFENMYEKREFHCINLPDLFQWAKKMTDKVWVYGKIILEVDLDFTRRKIILGGRW